MKLKCPDCEGEINVPDDAISGEIVSCPDCGQEYEVYFENGQLKLKQAETVKEDWGE
ncbi:MAG: alpha-aminoadipate/glutamate carrier protein LysW/ArgW [Candidatus Nezhaarchaeales archaeon]